MKLRLFAAFLLPIALACSGGTGGPSAPPPPPPAAVRDAAELLAGGPAAIPAPFQGITPGMTKEEAEAKIPGLKEQTWFKLPEWGDLMFSVDLDEDSGKVQRLYVNLPATTAEATVTGKWGPPTKAKGQYTAFEKVLWWNPTAGIRANLGNALVDARPLEFTAYTPVATLLGPEGPPFAFAQGGLMGQTVEQIGATFGDRLVCSYKDAAKTVDVPWTRLATKFPPDDDHSYFLELAPTEYGDYWTRVHLSFAGSGEVNRFRLSIPFEGNVAAKDATMALLRKKFGTEGETRDVYGKPVTQLSDNPVVTMALDSLGDAVEIEVELAKGGKRPQAGRGGGKGGGDLPGGRPGGRGGGSRPGGPGRPGQR